MSIKVNGVKKLTELTAATTINDSDVFMIETSSGSRKVTGAVLKTLINNTVTVPDVDGTLSVSGDAADAKIVGDLIQDIQDDMVTDVQINGTSIVTDGVAEIPIGGSTPGVVGINSNYGINLNYGQPGKYLYITPASDTEIKQGNAGYKPVCTARQHQSVFYGLAKAAGDSTQSASANAVGTYTDEAKTAIKSMLGVADGAIDIGTVETLPSGSDATASITGDYNDMSLNLGIPMGETGDSGVYVGDTAPTNGQNVWIDTSGEDDFEAIVQALYDMLPVAEEVEF